MTAGQNGQKLVTVKRNRKEKAREEKRREEKREAREAYLIERGQTLEPHGFNKKDET